MHTNLVIINYHHAAYFISEPSQCTRISWLLITITYHTLYQHFHYAHKSCNITHTTSKGKGGPCPKVSFGGVLISLTWWVLSPLVDKPQSLWHMASVSPDLRSPSQPQGVTALWLVPSDTALWQSHTGESSLVCNGVQAWLEPATHKSQVWCPTDSATTPSHYVTITHYGSQTLQ